MSDFKEDCYKHFNNKFKDAVKELEEKYAHSYRELWSMKKEVTLLKVKVKRLEGKVEE